VPSVDHIQLSAQLVRVGVASVGLVVGPLLVVEIAQDRSGAPAAFPRRAFCGVAAGPELYLRGSVIKITKLTAKPFVYKWSFAARLLPRTNGDRCQLQEQSPMALDHEIMTVKEVCGILRVNRSTLYKLVKQGKIPAFRIGTDWRFRKEGIERWMVEQTRGGPQ
jgi:excisionase family DNA binding protein